MAPPVRSCMCALAIGVELFINALAENVINRASQLTNRAAEPAGGTPADQGQAPEREIERAGSQDKRAPATIVAQLHAIKEV